MSEIVPADSPVLHRSRRLQFSLLTMLVAVLAFACAFAIIPHLIPENSLAVGCKNHLKMLLLGMHNYHAVYGCFPPAYIADANGRPMHSWRVLVLPFLCEGGLYGAYDFSEPWDGPNNSKLASRMPYFFACPTGGGGVWTTNYLAVVGPETIWPGDKPVAIRQIRDGVSNTIALVEVANSGIQWLEPRDLDFRTLGSTSGPGPTICGNHPRGPCVGLADGNARQLSKWLAPETLEALLTIQGGEPIPADVWHR